MKILFVLLSLALSFENTHERPSIFDMPGVQKPSVSATYENNSCYQKLISVDPATGQQFAKTLYSQLIQRIHEETNIPIDTIHQQYAEQYPGKTTTDIIVALSKNGFSRCHSPEVILSKFKDKVKKKLGITLNSETLAKIRDELIANGFVMTSGESNSDTSLFVKRREDFGLSEQNVSYEQLDLNNIYFSIMPDNYNYSRGFTPDIFYDFSPKIPDLFFDRAPGEFRVKNHRLIDQTRDQTLAALHEKYKGHPTNVSDLDGPAFKILSRQVDYLRNAEKSNWNFSGLAQQNKNRHQFYPERAAGNFNASLFCRDSKKCGSVVIEEEPIHKAYHDYLRNKQNLTIVDIGSSVGFNSVRYTLSDNRVILCDRSLDALIEAGDYMLEDHPDKAKNLYLTTQSADQLTLPENSVDVVFMGYLIKYFQGNSIDQMLNNIFNYLRPGGKLFLAEITPNNDFYKNYRNGPPPPQTPDSLYLGIYSSLYKIPFSEPSPNWSGEIGAIYNHEMKFQYNLTKVTEDDIIKGLERAGFRIEENLSTSTAAKNYTHMPAIQIIAVKP